MLIFGQQSSGIAPVTTLSLLQRIAYVLLVVFVYPVSLLPLKVLYALSDVGFIVLRYVIRYRVGVVKNNLRASFPEKTHDEIRKLTNRYFRHLTELTIEGLKALSITKKQLLRRVSVSLPEELTSLFDEGQHVIVAAGHLGNWEWAGLALSLQSKFQVVGLYLPHNNQYVSRGMVNRRGRFGMLLVTPDEVRRFLATYQGKPTMTVFIADQSPGNPTKAHWVDFMHRKTPFLVGPGKVTATTGRPLFFAKPVRLKRGYHRAELDALDMNPKGKAPEVITQVFAKRLEQEIRHKPEQWLWSHRRWKHSKDQCWLN